MKLSRDIIRYFTRTIKRLFDTKGAENLGFHTFVLKWEIFDY